MASRLSTMSKREQHPSVAQQHARPSVLLPVADGSEEYEAITIADTLHRAGFHVTIASVGKKKENIVQCFHGLRIKANTSIEDSIHSNYDLIVLPGGIGATKLHDCDLLIKMLRKQKEEGKYIAGICSAPAVVFEPHKLLEDPATCDPMHRSQMAGRYVDEKVVVHKNCITSQGPGTAIEFALKLVELLGGQKQCAKVEHEILYNLP